MSLNTPMMLSAFMHNFIIKNKRLPNELEIFNDGLRLGKELENTAKPEIDTSIGVPLILPLRPNRPELQFQSAPLKRGGFFGFTLNIDKKGNKP